MTTAKTPESNFDWLKGNVYPGRGIILGLNQGGTHAIQVYWIMGRSENSRNRVLCLDENGERIFTQAADPSKVQDPRLIIYNAMDQSHGGFIVSNGDQTDTVARYLARPANYEGLNTALTGTTYEPDSPNFTQRITGVTRISRTPDCFGRTPVTLEMSVLSKSAFWEDGCNRTYFKYWAVPGLGYCVTTYAGDGDPLPAYTGGLMEMPLAGDCMQIAQKYWDALNPDNRVALAVKSIRLSNRESRVCIINKYRKVT